MSAWAWAAFVALVSALVWLDLAVFHRDDRESSLGEALGWSLVWIAVALAFGGAVWGLYEHGWLGWPAAPGAGRSAALQYWTGWLVEKSLSVDNLFVIAIVFSYFRVPPALQHRVLFWGIVGAVALRGVMIAAGAVLIARFSWTIYVFGGLLLVSAVRLLVSRPESVDPERNGLVRLVRRLYPVTTAFDGHRFFTREGGRRAATPLLLALAMVESSDVLFAVDSIPAVFAVTRDPFLVFTSNIFAILGLRALYSVLSGLLHRLRYLKTALVFLLAYVGVKMLLAHVAPIPNHVSLAVIGGILAVGVAASLWRKEDPAARPGPPKA